MLESLFMLVLLPLLQQGLKLLTEKAGVVLGRWANQLIALVLTAVYVFITGGYGGLELPVWDGNLLQFVGEAIGLLVVAWSLLMGSYELIWDRLFTVVSKKTKLMFVTKDKLA